jgi:hypothetical protein
MYFIDVELKTYDYFVIGFVAAMYTNMIMASFAGNHFFAFVALVLCNLFWHFYEDFRLRQERDK